MKLTVYQSNSMTLTMFGEGCFLVHRFDMTILEVSTRPFRRLGLSYHKEHLLLSLHPFLLENIGCSLSHGVDIRLYVSSWNQREHTGVHDAQSSCPIHP